MFVKFVKQIAQQGLISWLLAVFHLQIHSRYGVISQTSLIVHYLTIDVYSWRHYVYLQQTLKSFLDVDYCISPSPVTLSHHRQDVVSVPGYWKCWSVASCVNNYVVTCAGVLQGAPSPGCGTHRPAESRERLSQCRAVETRWRPYPPVSSIVPVAQSRHCSCCLVVTWHNYSEML